MKQRCYMCGDEYEENSEFFLADDKPICCTCGEFIERYYQANTSVERDRARAYIMKQFERVTDQDVCNAIIDILESDESHDVCDEQEDSATEPGKSSTELGTIDRLKEQATYSKASGNDLPYVVIQVTLKEKFFGTGSGNLHELENIINQYAYKGYRLHTMATSTSHSVGIAGGDRIQATLVFEKK